jgi:hypothetical protein
MRIQNQFMMTLAVAALLLGQSCSTTPAQSKFVAPDGAAKALLQALKTDSTDQLRAHATIDSQRSNRIIPRGQDRMSFEGKMADLLGIG